METKSDRLSARELFNHFKATVTIKQMEADDFKACFEILQNAESIAPEAEFFAKDSLDRHLIAYCTNYAPPVRPEVHPVFTSIIDNLKLYGHVR